MRAPTTLLTTATNVLRAALTSGPTRPLRPSDRPTRPFDPFPRHPRLVPLESRAVPAVALVWVVEEQPRRRR